MNRRSQLFTIAALVGALLQIGLPTAQAQASAPRTNLQEGTKVQADSKAATATGFFCNMSALNADQRKHHRENRGTARFYPAAFKPKRKLHY